MAISKRNLTAYIIRGDGKVYSIAAASILAKVKRDTIMKEYALLYPGYGFERHVGYATRFHKSMISKLGPAKIHRKSFKPIRAS
jgi:ribonuclease HII